MAIALETFVKQLEDSGIVAQGKLENFIPPKAHPKSVEELVAELVKQNHLTKFQAQQVSLGKSKALILGNYTILDKIGAGGMGQVFKAEHRRMERIVAIKMLAPAMTKDAVALSRFQREVVAAAKLRHPNIVAADDAAEANGVHFLVMEYVEGKDLSATVKKDGPLPVNKAVNYILQAARGLKFAHKKGVVHRDIKPANLLLDNEGVVKILDMGLARIESAGEAATQAELTGTGAVMGTLDYMAPEQALSTRHADARADIYSLGCSLYYLIAGKAAYHGETLMAKLIAHREHPIPSLQDAQNTVPKQLDVIFRKMVAKMVEDRYQSMSAVMAALEGLGLAGSTTGGKGDIAATLALSSEDRKELASKTTKKPLGSLTEVVASERTKHLLAKIVCGTFATIIAPILVTYLIKYLEKKHESPTPPVATAPTAIASPLAEVTNTTSQPTVPATSVGGPSKTSPLASTAVASSVPAIDTAPAPTKAPFGTEQAKSHQQAWAKYLGTKIETTNSLGTKMILIPPGEFMMGSTDEQIEVALKVAKQLNADSMTKDRIQSTERPQHRVVLTKPFLMGATEVTIGQFKKFVAATSYQTEAEKAAQPKTYLKAGYDGTDDSPVATIAWNDAVAYCRWLSQQEHATYRLPTEAEWEYACRAGTTTQYSFGDDVNLLPQFGWTGKNAGGKANPAGTKLPNAFGLHDMHGNLYEWCQDFYDEKWYEKSSTNDPKGPDSGSSHVLRGGPWNHMGAVCRSAYRYNLTTSLRYYYYGFRVVRTLDTTAD